MPIYCFNCECGKNIEVVRPMRKALDAQKCVCGKTMFRNLPAENKNISGTPYLHTIHSDSLAIAPSQIEEHKRLFPNIELDGDCRPIFNNFKDHDAYLKKTGFVKAPKKVKPKGKRLKIKSNSAE